ncbi:cytochrome c biogenesis protein ResB [Naasia aerilata]|uniref:Cytochrome c biogenesis protein ResB n=1 Tax=Naasia aerilata TaxID=1162966 RepID=A0ABM8GBI7_9MICO|nr:cytochrome c biogenesis protein ResB [Naasia aerilata]BDZ45593.1 cytochrome c biogenesis protein ResB [Naasia aerilata]
MSRSSEVARPSDHIESDSIDAADPVGPRLGPIGWLRFAWRQLTNMRTALFLLLLLAIAAVPGSLVPQRSSDPNGVAQYRIDHPDLYPIVDKLQGFDVYTSIWFSAIYLLLFLSLIGCVLPRTLHHWRALRARPPRTPARLTRLDAVETRMVDGSAEDALLRAEALLRRGRYRLERYGPSISAERGYLRETGNLVFHASLVGILIAVALGGSFGYSGQKIVVEGEPFVNYVAGYDSFTRGRLVADTSLDPYRISLDKLDVVYEEENANAVGQAIDYTASVTVQQPGGGPSTPATIKVNSPLDVDGTNVYLLGNGYAPRITVRNADGAVAFAGAVPFLPQDQNLTSVGVVKVPDGLASQVGLIGFLYPTPAKLSTGALTSAFPGLQDPVLALNVFTGDLGLDKGVPVSVYTLDTASLTQLAGRPTDVPAVQVAVGQTVELPNGLGTITLDGVSRYASLEIHHDPTQGWVLAFAILVLAGLLTSLFVPRRRMWVKVHEDGDGRLRVEYAGLARGDDPGLAVAVRELADEHSGGAASAQIRASRTT